MPLPARIHLRGVPQNLSKNCELCSLFITFAARTKYSRAELTTWRKYFPCIFARAQNFPCEPPPTTQAIHTPHTPSHTRVCHQSKYARATVCFSLFGCYVRHRCRLTLTFLHTHEREKRASSQTCVRIIVLGASITNRIRVPSPAQHPRLPRLRHHLMIATKWWQWWW